QSATVQAETGVSVSPELLSSHSSPGCTKPSPHRARRQEAGQSAVSSSFPSSHASPGSVWPSPHVIGAHSPPVQRPSHSVESTSKRSALHTERVFSSQNFSPGARPTHSSGMGAHSGPLSSQISASRHVSSTTHCPFSQTQSSRAPAHVRAPSLHSDSGCSGSLSAPAEPPVSGLAPAAPPVSSPSSPADPPDSAGAPPDQQLPPAPREVPGAPPLDPP